MIALAAIALAVAVGYLAGGSLSNLAQINVSGAAAIILLFAVQGALRGRLVFTAEVTAWSLVVWLVATAVLAGLIIWNAQLPGAAVIATGLLLNLLVVAVNGGMPVDYMAAQRSVLSAEAPPLPDFYFYSRGDALLHYLGDVLPVRAGGSLMLLSVGDVLLLLGAVWFVVRAMTEPQPQA